MISDVVTCEIKRWNYFRMNIYLTCNHDISKHKLRTTHIAVPGGWLPADHYDWLPLNSHHPSSLHTAFQELTDVWVFDALRQPTCPPTLFWTYPTTCWGLILFSWGAVHLVNVVFTSVCCTVLWCIEALVTYKLWQVLECIEECSVETQTNCDELRSILLQPHFIVSGRCFNLRCSVFSWTV